jgi:hypothetical protein
MNGAPWPRCSPATSNAIEPGKAAAGSTIVFLTGHRISSSIWFTSDVDIALARLRPKGISVSLPGGAPAAWRIPGPRRAASDPRLLGIPSKTTAASTSKLATKAAPDPRPVRNPDKTTGIKYGQMRFPGGDAIGAYRMARVPNEFTILESGRSSNCIAVPISPSCHVAKARFAGMALTVISLAPPNATINGSAQALLFTSNPRADPTWKDVTCTAIRAGSHLQGLAVGATESPAPSSPYTPCLRHSPRTRRNHPQNRLRARSQRHLFAAHQSGTGRKIHNYGYG